MTYCAAKIVMSCSTDCPLHPDKFYGLKSSPKAGLFNKISNIALWANKQHRAELSNIATTLGLAKFTTVILIKFVTI